MPPRRSRVLPAAVPLALTVLLSCSATAAPPPAPAPDGLEVVGFLGEQRIAPGTQFAGTTVGGLSGLDRDPRTGAWFVVSDDRSALQPARFYTADLRFDGPDGALSAVELTGTTPLRRQDGATYPPLEGGDGTTADPEDIRVDPLTGQLFWSQEGERIVPSDGTPPTLIDPTVRVADRDGRFVRELPTPQHLKASADQRGIRQNLGPEGLAVAAKGTLVVMALEGPLLQDGPVPTRTEGARSRIILQAPSGGVVEEYAYPIEPIFADPVPADGFANNGVTAILAVDDADPTRFLVLERSFATGVGNSVRVYEVHTAGATNIAGGTPIGEATPVQKRLVADLAQFPLQSVDNVEGMAWGPDRADGSRTLVLVSDDNFTDSQVTQFVALAVR
jgi:hypothetical protein